MAKKAVKKAAKPVKKAAKKTAKKAVIKKAANITKLLSLKDEHYFYHLTNLLNSTLFHVYFVNHYFGLILNTSKIIFLLNKFRLSLPSICILIHIAKLLNFN